MPGYMIAGASRDATGSYASALQVFVVAIVIASLLLIGLRVPHAGADDDSSQTSGG